MIVDLLQMFIFPQDIYVLVYRADLECFTPTAWLVQVFHLSARKLRKSGNTYFHKNAS